MKRPFLIGIVAIAIATACAMLASDKTPPDQAAIRLKVGGKTIVEMRVLDADAFSMNCDQANLVLETGTTTAKGATLQFGGASGTGITVKAEEVEILRLKE